MKKLFILLIACILLFSSCADLSSSHPQQTADLAGSGAPEVTLPPETEPYVQTTEMFGEIYPVVEDTWHLSEWKQIPMKRFWFYEPIDFSSEAMKTYVKLPLEYEETVDGMTIKVEFFQETYPIFSYIQARMTYTNNTGKDLRFINTDKHTAGYFAAGGEKYIGAYDSPDFNLSTDADSTTVVPNGGSHVVEVIYLFTNHFDPNKPDHTYHIDAVFSIPGTRPQERLTFSISFPIEVLKHD